MNSICEMSHKTAAIVDLFQAVTLDEVITWDRASQIVRFDVTSTMPAYQSAKLIALKRHNIKIDTVRGVGFKRLNATDTANFCGARRLRSVRRQARLGMLELKAAMTGNLDPHTARRCTEAYSRLALAVDIARPVSNRPVTPEPEAAQPVNIADRLKAIK